MAVAQDQSIATPKDTIFARRILMPSIANAMTEIEAMTGSGINTQPTMRMTQAARNNEAVFKKNAADL